MTVVRQAAPRGGLSRLIPAARRSARQPPIRRHPAMKAKTIHCDECLEEIPSAEMYWEDERLYCGRCGSELEINRGSGDLLDEFSRRRITGWQPPVLADDDDDAEQEDEETEFESGDETWEEEEEAAENEQEGDDENGNGPRH
jgi:ribosomal protein S27AE